MNSGTGSNNAPECATICDLTDPQIESQENGSSKPQLSFVSTIFNMLCSAVGIGVLFLPSTLCGGGLFVGIAGILLIGLAADWSSRALIEVTCKTKSKSLEDMFKKVLGSWGANVYSISVFLLLVGALSIFMILMGIQTNDVYKSDPKNKKDLASFRVMSLVFSCICGLLLVFKNLKLLSYVSIIKIFVMIFILVVATMYATPEYARRREAIPGHQFSLDTFYEEFHLLPTIKGTMKALGSWQTAYLFHMGISDMYFSLENRSYSKWSKISRLSCLFVALFNLCFAVVGYLATADEKVPGGADGAEVVDLCKKPDVVFLSLYASRGLVNFARILIVLVLVASYPLLFYFLKEYAMVIIKNVYPSFYEARSKESMNNTTTVFVWVLILCASCITSNPFNITNLVVSIVGTLVVFLMPVLAWMKLNGGMVYVFTLGICGENNNSNKMNQNVVETRTDRVISESATSDQGEQKMVNYGRPSLVAMLSAQSVFWLSCVFIVNGIVISTMEYWRGPLRPILWREEWNM
eukprot:249780_1